MRTPTLPRVRPEVEANKIQKPELIRALNTRMGLKQSHTIPTLGSELLPVVVVDDLTQQSVRPEYWCSQFGLVGPPVTNNANWYLWNPPGSGILVRPRSFDFSRGHGNILNMVINNITEPPVSRKGGRRLVGGSPGAGIPQDFSLPAQQSVCSLYSGQVGGLPGATFWEQFMADGLTNLDQMPFHYNFDESMKILIYPGAALIWFLDGTPDATNLLSAVWTEEPLV